MIDDDDPFYGEVDYYPPQEIWMFKDDPIKGIYDLLGAIKDHVSRIQTIIDANLPIQNAEFDLQQIVKYYQAYCAVMFSGSGDDQLFFGTLSIYDRQNADQLLSQDELWQDIPYMIDTINRQPLSLFVVGSGMDALMELIESYQGILCRRAAGLN